MFNKITLSIPVSLLLFISAYAQPTVGVIQETTGSLDGYVLFAPFAAKTTYLIDKCGRVINTWQSGFRPGYSCYLLEDGSLLRACDTNNVSFQGAIGGGLIEKHDWEGNLTWAYLLSSDSLYQDHDICPLPNGNVLAVVLHKKTSQEAIAEGRDLTKIHASGMWDTKIMELRPIGSDSAEIVWEWSTFDHLIQDYNAARNNFGVVSDHPELLDINYFAFSNSPDWLHINSVAYNPELDQIVLSSNHFSEFWIIDHSTTTLEAASHSGGNSNKGGDILYRWGNPQAYGRGTTADQKIFNIHNANWIKTGYPGQGEMILFNNGNNRPEGNYSTVDSYSLPYNSGTSIYTIASGQPYQPQTFSWNYMAQNPTDFFSFILAGAERLSNGNTLMCEATKGNFIEVDINHNIVWKYTSPVGSDGIVSQGSTPLNNYVYRCTLYEPGYPAFINKDMTPGDPIELNPQPLNCLAVGINNSVNNDLNSVTLFPNPTDDKLNIRYPKNNNNNVILTVYDFTGRIVMKKEGNFNGEIIIGRTELPGNGIYFFNLQSALLSSSAKFILQ